MKYDPVTIVSIKGLCGALEAQYLARAEAESLKPDGDLQEALRIARDAHVLSEFGAILDAFLVSCRDQNRGKVDA